MSELSDAVKLQRERALKVAIAWLQSVYDEWANEKIKVVYNDDGTVDKEESQWWPHTPAAAAKTTLWHIKEQYKEIAQLELQIKDEQRARKAQLYQLSYRINELMSERDALRAQVDALHEKIAELESGSRL